MSQALPPLRGRPDLHLRPFADLVAWAQHHQVALGDAASYGHLRVEVTRYVDLCEVHLLLRIHPRQEVCRTCCT